MKSRLGEFLHDDTGQDLSEYTLILAFLLVTLVGLAIGYQSSIAGITNRTNTNLTAASIVAH